MPRRVLPLDAETSRDARLSNAISSLIAALLIVGTGVMTLSLHLTSGPAILVLIAAFAGAIGIWLLGSRGGPIPGARNVAIERTAPPKAGGTPGPILQYSSPRGTKEPMNVGLFLLGFFGSLAICGGGFLLLGSTADTKHANAGNVLYLLLVGVVVIGAFAAGQVLGRRPGWRGLGPGVATGMGLGMLALGPCAFCYLLTLG